MLPNVLHGYSPVKDPLKRIEIRGIEIVTKDEKEPKDVDSDEQQSKQQTPVEPSPQPPPTAEAALADAQRQIDSYKDLLLRKAAEFDNYKKRAESEAATIIKFANEDLLVDILPILDDFERSLKLARENKESDPFYRGLELIYQKLLKILDGQGVKPLECVGKEFDVHFHDALLQVPREDVPPNMVVEEVEKGYTIHGKVIRHAKVIVSASPLEDQMADRTPDTGTPHPDAPDQPEEGQS